ncbi:recombinase family protein [Streptomyces sp. NPDC047009]|uniref:recombinase family protein n=1 Tax=Streptomyces sp. NPDC047009 TaxID=3154496 RepID=UPI00340DCD01
MPTDKYPPKGGGERDTSGGSDQWPPQHSASPQTLRPLGSSCGSAREGGRTARSITDQHRDNLVAEQDVGPWEWGEAYTDIGSASKFATKAREDFERLTADLADGTFGASGDILVLWEISCLARETGKDVKLIDLCEAGG